MGTKPAADDPFDIEALQLTPEALAELVAVQKGSGAPAGKAKRISRQKTGFVMMTHSDAKAGFLALGCPQALVWHHLLYLAWSTKSRTIKLANKTLAGCGVSRWVKYRSLHNLEQAGLIKVERQTRKSSLVTLLLPQ